MRILVAEDEKDLNRLLSTRLKAEHYSVDSCFDGQEALDYLEGAPYDAVVLDIMMPVLDGLSVLKTMRQKGSQTPVLLLTAKDSVEDRVRGLDAIPFDKSLKFEFELISWDGGKVDYSSTVFWYGDLTSAALTASADEAALYSLPEPIYTNNK